VYPNIYGFLYSENLFTQFRHGDRVNLLKMNISSLVLRNIQIHSEPLLTERIFLGVGVRYIPTGLGLFASQLSSLDKISLDNHGVLPEICWYFGN